MRGKAVLWINLFCNAGITPAYAGKSFVLNFGDFRYRDHPRLCGEKFTIPATQNFELRITPAYAGKRIEGLLESMDE